MTAAEELVALRRRVGNLQPRDLVAAAERCGWTFDAARGRGSHGALIKPGRRPIIVPRKLKRGTVLAIIRAPEEDLADDPE